MVSLQGAKLLLQHCHASHASASCMRRCCKAPPLRLMHLVHRCMLMVQEENALLESPTGTGKTLCLLCATLAWREAWAKRVSRGEVLMFKQQGGVFIPQMLAGCQ